MEMTGATCNSTFGDFHLLGQSLLRFQLRPRFALSLLKVRYGLQFHPWVLPATTSAPCNFVRTPPRSLLEDGTSDSMVVNSTLQFDPFLAVKKKAAEVSAELRWTSIYLVGINSSIKSRLGKLLAEALRYYYFDSDILVEEASGGRDAAKEFRESDEGGYRESETEVLKQLSSMGRLVVCAGNGAVRSATNLALLRHGISIRIDVPLEMVASELVEGRVQLPASETEISGSHSKVLTQLVGLYEEMRVGYSTADASVSLQKVGSELGYNGYDEVTVEDMGLEVLKEIEKLMRVKKMMEEAAKPF